MKRILAIVLSVAAFLAVENKADAQLLKNLLNKSTTTTSTATTNGKAAGAALRALYTQYKADNRLDMTNLSNIANVATFSANVKGLKGQSDKGTFYKDFASGLVLGSNNLVNESNSTTVMNSITSLVENVDLSAATSTEKSSATASSDVANSITSILGLFK